MLHDVDKNNSDRTSPAVNAHDKGPDVRMAAGTTSVHPTTDATTAKGYLQTKNGRILGNDGANNVGLFGFDDAGNMVVKVAKPGYDANSASNANLIFNSAQNVFKIITSGTTSIPSAGADTSTATVAHGLSSVPIVMAFGLIIGNYNPFPIVNVNSSGSVISQYYCWSDATNVYFQVFVPGGTVGSATSIKYYILQETAN